MRFGSDLKRARLNAGLSQKALAELAHMSQGEISVLEAGQREPGLLSIVYIARGLHTTPADLLRGLK